MTQHPSFEDFQKSINQELSVIKDRVRQLIGSAHWGEDGRFKEAVLRNIINRFLPKNFSLGTGFIVYENTVSKQQDIIIYDNRYPVFFAEGDFVIVHPNSVRGIIEVKTSITKLEDVIKHLECTRSVFKSTIFYRLAEEVKEIKMENIFVGVFCYDCNFNLTRNSKLPKTVREALRSSTGWVNYLALGPNLFIRKWSKSDANLSDIPNIQSDFYNAYKLNNLAFSYFISNLIFDLITWNQDSLEAWENSWFLFPIEGGKEQRRLETIPIQPEKKQNEFCPQDEEDDGSTV